MHKSLGATNWLAKFFIFVNNFIMKNFKLSAVFDFVFGTSFVFFVSFVWLRFFVHNFWLTLFLSATITFVAVCVYHILKTKKVNKQAIKKDDIKNANAICNNFLLCTQKEVLATFYKKFNVKYQTKLTSNFLIVNDKILYPCYNTQSITDKDVFFIYQTAKKHNASQIIIACKNASQSAIDATQIIGDKKVVILQCVEAYKSIFLPLKFDVPKLQVAKPKKSFNTYLSFALNNQRTKNYAIVSIFLLVASFVLRYNIYYLIFSTLTALLALYSHFNKKYNVSSQQII